MNKLNLDKLSPPGAVTYSSNTTYVGDGTWDSTRNTFLLPNIQGLNFATMQYNGMGNRFLGLQEYQTLILGHGVVAAITFLFIVPISIFISKFYYYNPRQALRTHIGLQVFTIILATVVLILGYFAVGPARSLTNPHHGIGVAIYVLVLAQTIGGGFVHRFERGKTRQYLPMKLMLHNWIGWGTALLALAQIPIGLTLYGSPKWLFIAYTIVMAIYLFLFFIWSHDKLRRAAGHDERGSHVSGSRTDYSDDDGHHHHRPRGIWAIPALIAGGLGFQALKRRGSQSRHERSDSRTDMMHSARGSRVGEESRVTEKFSDDSSSAREENPIKERILGTAAGIGIAQGFRSIRDRFSSRNRDDDSERGSVRPPLGGSVAAPRRRDDFGGPGAAYGASRGIPPQDPSLEQFNRLEEGRALEASNPNSDWRRVEAQEAAQQRGLQQQSAVSRQTGDSYDSYDSRDGGAGRGILAAIGLAGAAGWWRKRRERKEQERVEAERQRERENERMYRRREEQPLNTSYGTPTRGAGVDDFNSPPGMRVGSPPIQPVPPPMTDSLAARSVSFQQPGQEYNSSTQGGAAYNLPPPPRANAPPMRGVDMAPPPPMHSTPPRGSPSYGASQPPLQPPPLPPQFNNRIDNQNIQSYPPRAPSATRAVSANRSPSGSRGPPPASQNLAPPPRDRSLSSSTNRGVDSPPVSVEVKWQNDGRQVTLRRVSEQEAAEREARRGRQQTGSGSDQSDGPHFRRAPGGRDATPSGSGARDDELHLSPGVASPPSARPSPLSGAAARGYDASAGDAAAPSELSSSYDTNRKRRRAERARAEQARLARLAPGTRVEFE